MSKGYNTTLWFKESASYGSAEDMSTGTRYVLPISSETLTLEIERLKTEHMRNVRFTQNEEDAGGLYNVTGSFTGKVPWGVEFGHLLKNLTGKVAGASTTHTYTWNDNLFVGLSIAINKGAATYIVDGAQIQSIDFSFTLGGYVEYTCNVVAKDYRVVAAVTTPSLTLETSPPYWLCHQVTFELDTVAESLTGVDLSCFNELADAQDQSYALGSNKRALLPAIGGGVTGTLRRRHDKDGSGEGSKFWDDFTTDGLAKLEIIVAHPNEGGWSATFMFTNCRFTADNVNMSDKGHVMEEVPFEAFDIDDATGTSSIVIIDDNSASPTAATGAYTGAGA